MYLWIFLSVFLFSLFFSQLAPAFDVIDATVLCDRFIGGTERNECLNFVKNKKPDTYISSVCHYLFDDKIFNDCLKLAVRVSVNPKELALCSDAEMGDPDRLRCIQKRARAGREFQRMPASSSKKSKAEARLPAARPAEASSSGKKVYPESKAGL